MNRQAIIETLRKHQVELNRHGVLHAALFGSRACGDAGPGSDIDIMIGLDDDAVPDLFAYAGIRRRIAALFDPPADVVDRAALKPSIRDNSSADAVHAF